MAIPKHLTETGAEQILIDSIRDLMQLRGIKEAELSRKTQIPPATLHKILSGKTSDPRISTLQTLANYFNVTVDELFTGIKEKTQQAKIQSIPIISWKDCIKGVELLKKLSPSNWENWLTTEYISTHAYGLISKPSMEPRLPKGTTLIIDSKLEAEDGDLIIVVYPDTQEATIRELSSDGPNKFLLPIGPNTTPERLTKNIRIIGVVTESKFSWSKR